MSLDVSKYRKACCPHLRTPRGTSHKAAAGLQVRSGRLLDFQCVPLWPSARAHDENTGLFVTLIPSSWYDPLATHCSILAWRIPQTEDPGRLQSMGSWRVGHEGVTNIFTPPVTWAPCWAYFGYPRASHTSPSPPHGDSNNSTDTRNLKSPNYTLEIWQ